MIEDIRTTIKAIQTLQFLPESEQTEYYDSVVTPLIANIAASIEAEHDLESIIGWLYIQSSTLDLAVEGITEVTHELSQQFPQQLQRAIDLLPLEQQVRILWLLREFQGLENLPSEIVEKESMLTSNLLYVLTENIRNTARSTTGILGEFVGTSTFQSTRGFPVMHGNFTLFAQDSSEIGPFTVNTGGSSCNYRTTNGPLPPGIYRVSNHRPNRTTTGMVLGDVGYSFDVDPTDGTQVFGRSLFRIHPDGGNPGTNGCLGVRETTTRLSECESHIMNLLQQLGVFKILVRY